MIKTLVIESQTKCCFIETDKEMIPIKECVDTGDNIQGIDYYNNIPVSISKDQIHSIYYLTDENLMFEAYQTEFNTVSDHLVVHDINIQDCREFLYKKATLPQKVISILLKKDFNDITIDELKALWKQYIKEYCDKFNAYIESELDDTNNAEYKIEMTNLKEQLKEIQTYQEIENFEDKHELIKFWPTLLMPAPGFVDV